jgi:hypothetical protein
VVAAAVVIRVTDAESIARTTTRARVRGMLVASVKLRILLTSLAAVAVLIAAGSADAAYKITTAKFRATVSGSQSTSWTLNTSNVCGSQTGSGSQTLTYHQKKPVTLVFWDYVDHHGMPNVYVAQDKSMGIHVKGTSSQTGTVSHSTTGKCEGGHPIGPPVAPPAPDCGTRPYAGTLRVGWYRPDDFPFKQPDDPAPLGNPFSLDEELPGLQYLHCPFYGPLILNRATYALLKEKTVFGKQQRIDLKADYHHVFESPSLGDGIHADTSVNWKMRLTRIG